MKDSVGLSLVRGRYGAALLALVAASGALFGWGEVLTGEAQQLVEGGLTLVAGVLAFISKIREL